MVKDVVKIIMKDTIYPSKDDFRGATEAYLIETHPEFYKKFTESSWEVYFNKENIHFRVSFVFENFYKFILKLINTKSKSSFKVIK